MAVSSVSARDNFLQTLMQPRDTQSKSASLEDKFLTLLLTQVRNQDPLNPLDNSQMTSQLAQISTVNGVEKLNRTMQEMAQGALANQQFQAGGLIGRGILSEGSSIVLEQGRATGGLVLQEPADRVYVRVLAPNGEQVATLDLGPRTAGIGAFEWDGKTSAGTTAADGLYRFEVDAVRGTKNVPAETLGFGRVQSVTLDAGQTLLNTRGLGSLAMDAIRQIL
jgi:flagellar basal-body rod modification protein FlgD